jgi:hypothetical protein
MHAMDTIRSAAGPSTPDRPKGPQFVHLKVHSAYSLLEGAITIPRLAKRAAAKGFPAVGLTDTGSRSSAARCRSTSATGRSPTACSARAPTSHARSLPGRWRSSPATSAAGRT